MEFRNTCDRISLLRCNILISNKKEKMNFSRQIQLKIYFRKVEKLGVSDEVHKEL